MSNIDVFRFSVNIDENTVFYNINEHEEFALGGLYYDEGSYRRMPEKVAETVSNQVLALHAVTAGGRVRFKTNSKYIAIKVKLGKVFLDPNTTVTGSAGFDVYVRENKKQKYLGTVTTQWEVGEEYIGKVATGTQELKEYIFNFPVNSEIKELSIGLEKEAKLEKAEAYKCEKQVVFYGSSITMGKCATRPGCIYESILSQRLDFEFLNLGFGGAAKGEKEIADYIASLDMSAFVLDYDWNAPNVEYLKDTHEKFFKIIREKHPNLPVIMMSRPKFYLTDEEKERKTVVEQTYLNAVNAGDKNVYFIPGDTLMDNTVKDAGTVDGVHPTDAGFFSMANVIEPILKKVLNL